MTIALADLTADLIADVPSAAKQGGLKVCVLPAPVGALDLPEPMAIPDAREYNCPPDQQERCRPSAQAAGEATDLQFVESLRCSHE